MSYEYKDKKYKQRRLICSATTEEGLVKMFNAAKYSTGYALDNLVLFNPLVSAEKMAAVLEITQVIKRVTKGVPRYFIYGYC